MPDMQLKVLAGWIALASVVIVFLVLAVALYSSWSDHVLVSLLLMLYIFCVMLPVIKRVYPKGWSRKTRIPNVIIGAWCRPNAVQ